MTFEKEQNAFGFCIKEIRESSELRGKTVQMEHMKTGARLFWVDNGAENMVFSVTFRTLPEDDTGVFHILEHSVLCGSKKYPVREPFVELLKSSMNTFLNAMTFQDMTMYPVSSRNPRDLLNLAGVYLDAVFAPTVMEDRKRFCQEGWHIDRDGEGNPVYKGVVFNEMKGSMSDTDTLIDRQIMRQLFPDTCYGFNSGGDPEKIPDLTYEQFREQYRRHYHPSNAYFFLDGNVPMEEMLPLIASYLDGYDRMPELPGTGFSARHPQILDGLPKDLRYEPSGLTLQIPSLDLAEGIVTVPFRDGEYPVEWLGKNIGLPEEFPRPGSGRSVLLGHDHLNTAEAGPFALLGMLTENARVIISDKNDQILTYSVFANEKIAADDMAEAERLWSSCENSLILITCEDERPEGGYASRCIVAAKPVLTGE